MTKVLVFGEIFPVYVLRYVFQATTLCNFAQPFTNLFLKALFTNNKNEQTCFSILAVIIDHSL